MKWVTWEGGSVQNLKNGWHHLWTGVGQPLSRTKYLVLLFNYIFHITFSNNNYESTIHIYIRHLYILMRKLHMFESKSWFCKTIFFHPLHTCKNPQKIPEIGWRYRDRRPFPITHDHEVNVAPFFQNVALMIMSDRGSYFGEWTGNTRSFLDHTIFNFFMSFYVKNNSWKVWFWFITKKID